MTCLLGLSLPTQQLSLQQINSHSHQSVAIINFHNSLLVTLGLIRCGDHYMTNLAKTVQGELNEKCNKNNNVLGYLLLNFLVQSGEVKNFFFFTGSSAWINTRKWKSCLTLLIHNM